MTGMGLVTPLGTGTEFVLQGILQGKSGIRALSDPKFSKLPCRVAGLVPTEGLGITGIYFVNLFCIYEYL